MCVCYINVHVYTDYQELYRRNLYTDDDYSMIPLQLVTNTNTTDSTPQSSPSSSSALLPENLLEENQRLRSERKMLMKK